MIFQLSGRITGWRSTTLFASFILNAPLGVDHPSPDDAMRSRYLHKENCLCCPSGLQKLHRKPFLGYGFPNVVCCLEVPRGTDSTKAAGTGSCRLLSTCKESTSFVKNTRIQFCSFCGAINLSYFHPQTKSKPLQELLGQSRRHIYPTWPVSTSSNSNKNDRNNVFEYSVPPINCIQPEPGPSQATAFVLAASWEEILKTRKISKCGAVG